MILFVAPDPSQYSTQEGYITRVKSIDNLFKNEEKHYLSGELDIDKFADLASRADFIYIHSIYQAMHIIDYYPAIAHKTITDLHGVVPEEELLKDDNDNAKKMELIEQKVFNSCKFFVAVTNSMVEHYVNKYPKSKYVKWFVLPIFDSQKITKNNVKQNLVIYSGGAQKWQNVKMMKSAIESTTNNIFKYVVLTQQPNEFEDFKYINNKDVSVITVEHNMVYSFYNKSKLGFILRDKSIVNKVACPTKLIEYLISGVVPIVSNPDIGDFKKYGYKYILLSAFINNKYSDKIYESYAEHNYKVINQIKKDVSNAKKSLIISSKMFKKNNTNVQIELTRALIMQLFISNKNYKLFNELKNENNVINRSLEAKEKELIRIYSSKRWRYASGLAKVRFINKY